MDKEVKEPSAGQCSTNERVFEDDDRIGFAIWYPQMGGYVGKAVALLDREWFERDGAAMGGCIDVLVWHDGEFPFGGNKDKPRLLHHCDPQQFVDFGSTLTELNGRGRKEMAMPRVTTHEPNGGHDDPGTDTR